MILEFDKTKKNYSYAEVADAVLKLWPATAAAPLHEEVLGRVKELVPNGEGKEVMVNLVTLTSAVECIIRSSHGDFYTDWEQLLCATRAIPLLIKTEHWHLVTKSWDKYAETNKELDEDDTDALGEAVLKPSPKIAWNEASYRFVCEMIDKKYLTPCIKLTAWQKAKGKKKQQEMLDMHQGLKSPPPPLVIARVERSDKAQLSPADVDYQLDVLKLVFETGFLGGLKRTNYQAPFDSREDRQVKPYVLHDPWSLMQLRELSKRTRTWVDDLLVQVGLKDAVERARTVHLTIAKRQLMLVDCWSGIVGVIKSLTEAYPLDEHAYICLGGSPAPIMIAMEQIEPTAQIFHLPVSGIKGGVDYWMKQILEVWGKYSDAICMHFSRYLPPLGQIRGNKLVIVDYTSTGTALAVGMTMVKMYYERLAKEAASEEVTVPMVRGFALCTSFHPNPTLLPDTVLLNLHKSSLGLALEKQTLKGTGLRGLEKMELSSLQTTPEQVPDTRLDVAGLMRMLGQIQRQMKEKK